jgi:hypothetical protein
MEEQMKNEIKKKHFHIDSMKFKHIEWDEEDWGISLKISEKEDVNNITIPILSELNYAMSRLEDLYKFLGEVIDRKTGKSNGAQLKHFRWLIESMSDTIDKAYQIPSKQALINTIKECLDTLDLVDEEKERWQKRAFALEDKYEPDEDYEEDEDD